MYETILVYSKVTVDSITHVWCSDGYVGVTYTVVLLNSLWRHTLLSCLQKYLL